MIFDLVHKAREGLGVNKAACGVHTTSLLIDGGDKKWGCVRRLHVVSDSIVSEEGTERQHMGYMLPPHCFRGRSWAERGCEAVCEVYAAFVVLDFVCETEQGLEAVGE